MTRSLWVHASFILTNVRATSRRKVTKRRNENNNDAVKLRECEFNGVECNDRWGKTKEAQYKGGSACPNVSKRRPKKRKSSKMFATTRCQIRRPHRASSVREHRPSTVDHHVFKYSSIRVFEYSGIQVFKYSSIRVFQYSSIQVFEYLSI